MDIGPAKQGGVIAAEIEARNARLAEIAGAKAGGWVITTIRARNPVTGQEMVVNLDTLDPTTSAACFDFATQIYQAQLAALTAELMAL